MGVPHAPRRRYGARHPGGRRRVEPRRRHDETSRGVVGANSGASGARIACACRAAGPPQWGLFKAWSKGVYPNVAIEGFASDDPAADLFKTVLRQISEGQVTAQDIDWAIRVDAIAGEAESAFKRGDVVEAIERYRY